MITPLERDKAANDMSEANFALTLKDWGRAEGLYAKATELCPDEGDAWVSLGSSGCASAMTRMRCGGSPAPERARERTALGHAG